MLTCGRKAQTGGEKAKRPERALEFFGMMMKEGVVPDLIIYNALISSCEKGN